ncbi:MAG: HNH endonuclease [Mycobacterium sp.]|uniref:HNH endonuclease n=1 Tax=Mycobacterium sp. TaxID=1785 RepID=UPI003F94F019
MTPYHRRIRSTAAWAKLAKQVIAEERYCWLRLPGCTVIADSADHIIPIISRPELALVRSNIRAACRSCNYRRGHTPVSQLDDLRRSLTTPTTPATPTTSIERSARRHIGAQRKTAPATAFFNTTSNPLPTNTSHDLEVPAPQQVPPSKPLDLWESPQPPPIMLQHKGSLANTI